MIRTIYNDNIDFSEENIEQAKQTLKEYYDEEDVTDEQAEQFLYSENQADFECECSNLDKELDNRIIAIADLGLWDGRRTGYKLCSNNLNEVMFTGNEDYNHIYYDGYNVCKKACHHDGTNYITFRELRPNVDIEKFTDMLYNGEYVSKQTLNRYTKSLRKYVKEVYGW